MNEALLPNSNLLHYRIVSKLGAGGMGEVYLALDTKLGRKVALKVLPGDLASNRDRMERFVREARSAAVLNHPNIAQIFEIGEDKGVHFIAMEFVEGVTLRDQIYREQSELRKLLRYLQHVAEGLAKAHSSGIVHRDLKPDNIMITREGHAKILDFGLAKLIEPQLTEPGSEELATAILPQQSIPGVIMGTVGYMSPEQAKGKTKEIDHRSDIFSFGCILFEAATAHKPFAGDSVVKSLHQTIYEPAPLLKDINPAAPVELQRIVRRCLAKDPDERYQTIKDVAIELKELRRELESAADFDNTVPPPATVSSASQDPAYVSGPLNSVTTPPSLSSAEYLVKGFKQHKTSIALTMLIILGAGALSAYYLRARNSEGQINSIAVLPFQNRSSDADTEYLSEGLAESLIYRLSQLPHLKVSPTNSVLRYKGQDADTQKIATELGVDAVMSGRLVQRGDNLTISVELIDARSNKLLWGEQYERKMADLLATQREIANAISQKLQLKLAGNENRGLTKQYTNNNEAYQLYLRGRFYWNRRTGENINKAIEVLRSAIEKDPNFALAYAALADCYVVSSTYTGTRSNQMLPKAKFYATKAIELDATLAEPHASLGLMNWFDFNLAESQKEFLRAIDLNANYPTAHHWYSRYLRAVGRLDEAFSEIKRAEELDPLSLVIINNVAENYIGQGKLDLAEGVCQRMIELDPNFWAAHQTLGILLIKQGRNSEALASAEKSIELSKRSNAALSLLGFVYGKLGRRGEAEEIIKELEAKHAKDIADGRDIAIVYVGLAESDKAFEWLEKSYQYHSFFLAGLNLEPLLDPLHADPRWSDLKRRVGLPYR